METFKECTMAIQTSLRVRKTFANQFASDTNLGTGCSRLYMFFVSGTVQMPTGPEGVKAYLDSVLNYSPNYGGASSNRSNLLAWTKLMGTGGAVAGDNSPLVQSGDSVLYTPVRSITPVNTGTVGSIFVISLNYGITTNILNAGYMGLASVYSSIVLPTASGISSVAFGIPEALPAGSANIAGQVKNYYCGLHFITDSVGSTSSSASVKMSNTTLTSGTPFTLNGFAIKCKMA